MLSIGIRKIEDDIDLKEAMKRKAIELKQKELEEKAKTREFAKDKIKEIAIKHGVILALDPELRGEIKELQRKFNIPSSRVITERIEEIDVLRKKRKIDHEKLGMLAYQRVLMQKEETGGIMPISDVFEIVNTGILVNHLEMEDVIKAMYLLKKNKVIPSVRERDEGIIEVSFFSIQHTDDEAKVISLVSEKGFISLEETCSALTWSQERALRALNSLESSGFAKKDESYLRGKKWYFPSIS